MARSRGKLTCFAISQETAGAVALAHQSREGRLYAAGGHSSHIAPRSRTDGERPPADAVFGHLPRHSQRSGARASVTRIPAVRWRSQITRRTTVLHRTREASHRCSALSWRGVRSQLARTARARGKLACFAISRDTASAVALARRSREGRLCATEGHSLHVAPRSCTQGEWPPADAVPFRIA